MSSLASRLERETGDHHGCAPEGKWQRRVCAPLRSQTGLEFSGGVVGPRRSAVNSFMVRHLLFGLATLAYISSAGGSRLIPLYSGRGRAA